LPEEPENEKRRIRKKAKSFAIEGTDLFYVRNGARRKVISELQKDLVIKKGSDIITRVFGTEGT